MGARLWEIVQEVVEAKGLCLFDIEHPSPKSLRVYISKKGGSPNLDDCALVSRELSQLDEFMTLLPEQAVLEISSPGVNRKLRRPEHFRGAVGERVKITVNRSAIVDGSIEPRCSYSAREPVVLGVLTGFDGACLEIDEEKTQRKVMVRLGDIAKARVDFLFSDSRSAHLEGSS